MGKERHHFIRGVYCVVCVSVCALLLYLLPQLGYEMSGNQTTPKRVDTLYGRKIRQVSQMETKSFFSPSSILTHLHMHTHTLTHQISAGVRHCLALDTPPPAHGDVMFAVPLAVPARYSALRDVPCKSIHARLMLLNHFARLMVASWKLFSIQNISVS